VKLQCVCGEQIVDQTDALPNKASLIPDQDDERVWAAAWADLGSLVTAARRGRTDDWTLRHLGEAPRSASDEDLVWQYLSRVRVRYSRTLFECVSCGRLWVERSPGGEMVAFIPDSGIPERVLRSE
jgi:hypothetical protein